MPPDVRGGMIWSLAESFRSPAAKPQHRKAIGEHKP